MITTSILLYLWICKIINEKQKYYGFYIIGILLFMCIIFITMYFIVRK